MDNDTFFRYARRLVVDYFNENVEKTDNVQIDIEHTFIVWSCKVLQNNKALVSTTVNDGMYYEITYNGDKKEFYLDAYKKWQNKCIKLEDIYNKEKEEVFEKIQNAEY